MCTAETEPDISLLILSDCLEREKTSGIPTPLNAWINFSESESCCEGEICCPPFEASEDSSSVSTAFRCRGRTLYSPVSQINREPDTKEADSMRLFCFGG